MKIIIEKFYICVMSSMKMNIKNENNLVVSSFKRRLEKMPQKSDLQKDAFKCL